MDYRAWLGRDYAVDVPQATSSVRIWIHYRSIPVVTCCVGPSGSVETSDALTTVEAVSGKYVLDCLGSVLRWIDASGCGGGDCLCAGKESCCENEDLEQGCHLVVVQAVKLCLYWSCRANERPNRLAYRKLCEKECEK